MKTAKRLLSYGAIALIWLAIWWIAALIVNAPIILPSPVEVISKLSELISETEFWLSILYSLIRVLFGLLCATVIALLTAAVSFKFSLIERFLKPLVTVIKSTPIVSFVFVAYIVFSKDLNALPAFIAGLIVFPVMHESTLDALKRTPKELVEVSEVFGATFIERLRYLWIPTALPSFISSSKTSIGLAWKSGVAAEALIAIPSILSIGNEIYNARLEIEAAYQFAWTLVIIILSLSIELVFSFAAKKLTEKIL